MEKRNGQALVEFIIILPILVVILLGIVDFGLIIYKRNILENTLEEASNVYHKTENKEEVQTFLTDTDKRIKYSWYQDNNYLTLEINEDYDFLTPGLNLIFGESYKIEAKRVMYNG